MTIRTSVEETAHDVFESAEDTVGAFADKAYETGKAQAENVVNEQKNAFKRFAATIVRALRRGGDEMRDEGYGTAAGFLDDVATKAEDMTDEIDDLDLRGATERAEDFVRARPLIAYGALAVTGFLVANALQGAAHRRHERERQIASAAKRKSAPAPASKAKSSKPKTAKKS